jgi:uncharacterized protein involved in exopolysaccharide biosynthesis
MMRGRVSAPFAPNPAPSEDLLGWSSLGHWISFVLRSPFRHRKLALGAFAAVFVLAVLAAALVPPRFQVTATLLARPGALRGALGEAVSRESENPIQGAREAVLRRESLVTVARKTDLVKRYLEGRPRGVLFKDWISEKLGSTRDPNALEQNLVDSLGDRLQVWTTPDGVVTFTFAWWSPEIAVAVVGGAMESFIDARHETEIKAVGDAVSILQAHQSRLEQEVADAVDRLEQKEKDLKARPAVRRPGPAPAAPAADAELSRLQREVVARKRAIGEAEQTRKQRLTELQAELTKQEAIYTSDHPIVQGTRRLLSALETPSSEVAQASAEMEEMQRKILERGGSVPTAPVPGPDAVAQAREFLEGLDPRLEFDRSKLDSLLDEYSGVRARIVSAMLEMQTAEAAFKQRYSVIQPPQLPRGPIKPYGLLFTLGGILGGLALAFFVSTAADLWKGVIQEPWQMENDLQLPVLAIVRRDTLNRTASKPPAS